MTRPIDPPREDGGAAFEARVRSLAADFRYPPTPDIAAGMRARLASPALRRAMPVRRLAQVALIVVLLLALLMAVPDVRAGVIRFFRIGAVKIFILNPTPTPTPTITQPARPVSGSTPGGEVPLTATPQATPAAPTAIPTFALDDLDGETTLAEARARAGFPVRLPTYPADLGAPDRVYFQPLDTNIVVLVWLDKGQPGRVRMSLHALGPGSFAIKRVAHPLAEVEFDGRFGVWTTGPYELIYKGGGHTLREMVDGHVLVWIDGELTYRLETSVSLEEAVQIARSVQ